MAQLGTVFQIIPEGGNHFWFVISHEKDGLLLAVNVTDAVNCPDSTCVLNPGDHPAIVKPSAVYYRKARLFESQKIDALIAEGKYIRGLAKCTPAILQKIISGAKSADDLTLKFLSYLP